MDLCITKAIHALLILFCCFSGIASKNGEEDECSKFPEFMKGKPIFCTDDYRPICGTNNVTYPNLCMFCAVRSEEKDLKVKHKGECKEKDECSEFTVQLGGFPNKCTLELAPICGSDGVTYPNKCGFCIAKRLSGNKITIVHNGTCEQDGQQVPQVDICSHLKDLPGCPRIYNPLCGTDGVTYPNICEFCKARRESGGNLQIRHKGECALKQTDQKLKDIEELS